MEKMKINVQRLTDRLKQLGETGKTAEGICREAFTPAHRQGVELLKDLMEQEGLETRVDAVGNVYGRRRGRNSKAAPILAGSHLDTVRNGGLYDGVLGVAAALECAAALNDCDTMLENDLEIVAFNAEEGGPLGGTFGSRVAMGNQSLDIDKIDEKLAACGLTREDILAAKLDYVPARYLELHIEQGIQLYREGLQIGIVEGIVGITRYRVTVCGEANHAGTTPMAFRRDALVAASRLVWEINKMAGREAPPFVATVGKMEVFPNSVNVVPGRVEFILELREMDQAVIDGFVDRIKAFAAELTGYQIGFEPYSSKGSVGLDSCMADELEEICRSQGLSWKRMYSGAGHDAMELAQTTPSALIFIPSKDGISHSKEEYSSPEDIAIGVQALLEMILRSGGGNEFAFEGSTV